MAGPAFSQYFFLFLLLNCKRFHNKYPLTGQCCPSSLFFDYTQATFQFGGEAMEVVPLLECGSCVVQLSLSEQNLLISTLARSLLLDLQSGRVTQVSFWPMRYNMYIHVL
jgi:hypothetical protein